MISTPTVLILGAGASYPYGFPTARGLKRLICDTFSSPTTAGSRLLGEHSDYSRDEFFGFREAFLKSGQSSVDAFLQRRPNFLGVGKLAIAYCLMPFENEATLFSPDVSRGGDWYEYLAEKLNASFESFGNNQLSVVTFNYDRSLEHYLLTTLQNLHGRTFDECKTMLDKIRIVHVYGQLGKQPYPQEGSHVYRPDNETFSTIADAASGIRLVHEPAQREEIQDLFVPAKRICFLGFGYHAMNVARLTFDISSGGSKWIIGTARGLIGREVSAAQELVQQRMGSRAQFDDTDNLVLLRKHLIFG